MQLLRLILFFGSASGYLALFVRRFGLRFEFAPFMYCAFISTAMLLAGLLNIMPAAAAVLFVAGYALLAVYIWKGRKSLRFGRNAALGAGLLLASCYFALLCRDAMFTQYDDFSHWALVVKDMLLNNRLPAASDTIVMFKAYPLGSSLFIYYACGIIGSADACCLWAQLFMMLCYLLTMAAFIDKKHLYLLAIPVLFAVYSLCCKYIYDLGVDSLLPLAGVGAFAGLYYYRGAPKKAALFFALPSIWLVNIKNSGVFFWLVCLIYLIFLARGEDRRRRWKLFLWGAAPAAAALLVWNRHVAHAFSDAGVYSKHAMSLENFYSVFRQKTLWDIVYITRSFVSRLFSLDSLSLRALLAILAVLALLYLLRKADGQPENRRELGRAAIALAAVLVCYQIGLLAMYIFSMPDYEALELASFDRYESSAVQFVYGIFAIWLTGALSKLSPLLKPKKAAALAGMAAIAVLCLVTLPGFRARFGDLFSYPSEQAETRTQFQALTADCERGERYLIINGSDDAGYLAYLAKYEFWSSSAAEVYSLDGLDPDAVRSEYDYLILWDCSAETQTALKSAGYAVDADASGRQVIALG